MSPGDGWLFLLPQLSPKDKGIAYIISLPPFSSLLDLESKSFFTPPHFTLLSNRGLVLLHVLALLLPLVQKEGKQHFRRVLSSGGLKSIVGLELLISSQDRYQCSPESHDSRKSQDLATLN